MRKILSVFIVILIIFVITCVGIINITSTTGLEKFKPIFFGIEEEPNPIIFDKNITFTYEYISGGAYLPCVLYTPSTASEHDSIPLIVWLHGSGEVGVGKNTFLNSGLLRVLNEWKLDGFNAYVLCPHLSGPLNSGNWCSATNNIQSLLEMIIENYNIDCEQIILVGHSMGGYGAIHTACKLPEYFSKLVVLSGYQCKANLSEITIPTIGYVGTSRSGEDISSIRFMTTTFAAVFGEENTFSIESSHGNLPNVVFNQDVNNNGQSDVLEWMFANKIN